MHRNRDLLIYLAADGDDVNGNLINHVGEVAEQLLEPLEPQEIMEYIPRIKRPRNENFYEVTIPRFNDDLFKEHFRMSRASFEYLQNIIGNNIQYRHDQINLGKKLMLTIWLLAKPESFLAAGDRFGIAKSTSHKIFKEIVRVLRQMMNDYIRFPNAEQRAISVEKFRERSRGFPGVVGAIDGCHIPIKQPEGNAHDFYNRKGFHSIILQGTCDSRGRFIDCFIGSPGRMHDARVFRNSPLHARLLNVNNPLLNVQEHLIGDSAYPLMNNLMCPYRDTGHLVNTEIQFNVKLSCIRSVIERTFGMLKNKFRRLKYLDIADLELGNDIIAASCVLHNFLIDRNEINVRYEDENNDRVVANENINMDMPGEEAVAKRNNISRLLLNI